MKKKGGGWKKWRDEKKSSRVKKRVALSNPYLYNSSEACLIHRILTWKSFSFLN